MRQSDLVELKYLSEADSEMNIWGLTRIVDISIASNKLHSITGILFFDMGYFGQILEGTRSVVEETWGKIQKDSRHHLIELSGIVKIEKRRYPQWSIKLFDIQAFSVAFPQFAELIAKIDDHDTKLFETLRSLWQEH